MIDGTRSASGAANAASATFGAPRAGARSGSIPAADMLPSPSGSPADAMAAMYLLLSKGRASDMLRGAADVKATQMERQKKLQDEMEALRRQHEADGDGSRGLFGSIGHMVTNVVDDAEDLRLMDIFTDTKQNAVDAWNSPNLWKDVEKGAKIAAEVAAVVAASATTVVTFGAGAPALALVCVGVAMSAGSIVDSELHVLQECGVDAKTAGWIDTGLALGGAACTFSGGVAAMNGGSAATNAAIAATHHMTTAEEIAVSANAAHAGLTMVQGTAEVKTGNFRADSLEAQADVKAARHEIEKSERLQRFLLDSIAACHESTGKALEALSGAMQTQAQTLVVASGRA